MTLNDVFNQLMLTHGKPTPNAIHQNNVNFLALYNPQGSPKQLFKRCADCQEMAIIMKVPYIDKQLLMNVINLLVRCRMCTRNMEDWDRRADANKIWLHLCPLVQTAYQCCLQTGATTAAHGGYINRYKGLSTEDDVSNNDTAETIASIINLHIANLSAQTRASIDANTTQINASLQQLVANNNQLNLQQQAILQQMAMPFVPSIFLFRQKTFSNIFCSGGKLFVSNLQKPDRQVTNSFQFLTPWTLLPPHDCEIPISFQWRWWINSLIGNGQCMYYLIVRALTISNFGFSCSFGRSYKKNCFQRGHQ